MGPVAARLPGNRLHLQHGPIDLIIGADGANRERAFGHATQRFATILEEVVAELPLLRQEACPSAAPEGEVGRAMHRAAVRMAAGMFATPMIAVAGAVADAVLAAMTKVPLTRAYVNNGGDIALHLSPGETYRAQIQGLDRREIGRIQIRASDGIRGIATSGRGGRSLSLGIADTVTVLARTAAEADAAATLVANAVDLADHPAIARRPAREIAPESDLGDHLVPRLVIDLPSDAVQAALARGAAQAGAFIETGRIRAAALALGHQTRLLGAAIHPPALTKDVSECLI